MSNARSCSGCKGAGHRFIGPDATGDTRREVCADCHGSGLAEPNCAVCDEPITGKPEVHSNLHYHGDCLAALFDHHDGVCIAYAEAGADGCLDCSIEQSARASDAAYDAWRDDQVMRGVA